MTIKDFAGLCGCNPQTLRYYDHIDLMKPARADRWSGYRYYDKEQALVFVKIKNLQSAGFTIDEIKALLHKDNRAVYEAFNQKIAQQEQKLQKIKEIQRSYQNEMSQMTQKLAEIKETITQAMLSYDPEEEFGIDKTQYDGILGSIDQFFGKMIADEACRLDYWDAGNESAQEKKQLLALLDDPAYTLIYEKHGWTHVKDYLDELETPAAGSKYCLCFQVVSDKANKTAFANMALALLIGKNHGKQKETSQWLRCLVTDSEDGENHFWLLKRR